MQDILKNEEINTMIYTIGAGVGTDFDLESVNYNKVIIMTDADTDGEGTDYFRLVLRVMQLTIMEA